MASSGSDAYFCCEAPYSDFESIKVDGNVIASSNYTVTNSLGYARIKLHKEYIGNLGKTVHQVQIVSTDGVATANFTVGNAITFYIYKNYENPTTYTGTDGMTWDTWLKSTGVTNDNGEVYIDRSTNLVYIKNLTSSSYKLQKSNKGWNSYEDQTPSSVIVNDMHYVCPATEYTCCFDAGSQVLMADGTTKNIEEVVVGDMVISLNEDSREFVTQRVKGTIIKHNSDDLVYVNLSDGTRIGMRAYHPLLTVDGWKSLRPEHAEAIMDVGVVPLLEVGDILVGHKENVSIISIETRPDIENYDTYNLDIQGYDNYIVNGIVAHNAGCK